MTREQQKAMEDALGKATTALGVAGEAATLGKKMDAERALKEAGEELAKCRDILGRIRLEDP